jgi:triphosphoribosyl-dephospho-CoA synthase
MSISSESVKIAFVGACLAELEALKPGNVHVHAPGHGMCVEDFIKSANAAAPAIAAPDLSVGERIRRAVEATRDAVGQNTNLGIVLLAAPLAHAAFSLRPGEDLRARLRQVLSGLDVADARSAFRAIVVASPGGLGGADHSDVRAEARVSLLEAMREASGRDSIARAYVTGYDDIFGLGLSKLAEGRERWEDERLTTAYVYMNLLSTIPDTHIARKFGKILAESVSETAGMFMDVFDEARRLEDIVPELMELDAAYKSEKLNPGATADLTVAALFASALSLNKNP